MSNKSIRSIIYDKVRDLAQDSTELAMVAVLLLFSGILCSLPFATCIVIAYLFSPK